MGPLRIIPTAKLDVDIILSASPAVSVYSFSAIPVSLFFIIGGKDIAKPSAVTFFGLVIDLPVKALLNML